MNWFIRNDTAVSLGRLCMFNGLLWYTFLSFTACYTQYFQNIFFLDEDASSDSEQALLVFCTQNPLCRVMDFH